MSRWTKALTTAGATLIASAANSTFNITKAVCGSGYVDTTDMSAAEIQAALEVQTAVKTPIKNMPITAVTKSGAHIKVRTQLSNSDIASDTTLHQIGFYAKVGNSGTDTLFMVYNSVTADPIPSHSNQPGFSTDFLADITVNSGGEVTVTVDSSASVSNAALEQILEDYPTNTSLATTLENYPTSTVMAAAIKVVADKLKVLGILKGDGTGAVSAANGGSDYQQPTQSLAATTDINNDDTFPMRDTSESAHKKVTWSSIVTKMKSSVFGNANGLLKSNGSGVISVAEDGVDFQKPTQELNSESIVNGSFQLPVYDPTAGTHKKINIESLIGSIGTVECGQYTGDGEDEKEINLGYKPKILYIGCGGTYSNQFLQIGTTYTMMWRGVSGTSGTSVQTLVNNISGLITDTGFTAKKSMGWSNAYPNSNMNVDGYVYFYAAVR